MSLSELLNPAAESHEIYSATDEDIYTAVMEAKKAHSDSDADSSGMPDSDEPAVTRREALQAVLTLWKFTKTINDPFFRNAEVMLASLGQRARAMERNMKDTHLTDYFPRT
ncbi:uncharacterized protein EI90DRAFT_3022342 [Cantharellus anzutake]|uniref:uncharacterized protein n=1 Tax=Cantharellus anzutake TaxID=1750568 RepID=UPI001907F30A|nr:uncharacterized protein EI90DRAFT_3022342 [Cantharellus anzutake]KAF8314379.1 hypothetical protein EI90DRAFT_3022342 [Cantharellus anzutake]